MKFDVTMRECIFCPKCGKFLLEWSVSFAEEELHSASCPECGCFFANGIDCNVEDEEG